jgi:hypothetical protein
LQHETLGRDRRDRVPLGLLLGPRPRIGVVAGRNDRDEQFAVARFARIYPLNLLARERPRANQSP